MFVAKPKRVLTTFLAVALGTLAWLPPGEIPSGPPDPPPRIEMAPRPAESLLVLEVAGLRSERCDRWVERRLLVGIQGVDGVAADHSTDRIVVRFVEDVVGAGELTRMVESCSFRVRASEVRPAHECPESRGELS